MTTQVTAAIDRGLISGFYYHTGSTVPVDLVVKVYHRYVSSNNVQNEVQIEEFNIPSNTLKLTGAVNSSVPLSQQVDFRVNNLKYTENLVIQVDEIRNNSLVSTRVDVMIGDELRIPKNARNPLRSPTHEENQPPEEATRPDDNIVVPDVNVGGSLYSFKHLGLKLIQSSRKIFLDTSGFPEAFQAQDYNQLSGQIFIENSIKNYLSNSEFSDATTSLPVVPLNYIVEAPGFTITSLIVDGPIEGVRTWKLRASNTNSFSAFDTILIKYTPLATIDNGLNSLTASVYYRIASDFGLMPFTIVKIKTNFYDQDQLFISSQEKYLTVGPEDQKWRVLGAAVESVPLTAQFANFSMEVMDVNSTDPFVISLTLPQLEGSTYPTSRALYERIQDQFTTNGPVVLNKPFYAFLKTTHIAGPTSRGLLDNTTVLKEGLQWFVSGEKLYLRVLDASGGVSFSADSAPLSAVEGDVVEYGVSYDGTDVRFYKNQVLLSTHPISLVLNYNKPIVVGSLLPSNTTINAQLFDFGISRDLP